jgi:uncharacterized integral membrane protein
MSLWHKDSDPGLVKVAKVVAWSAAAPFIVIVVGVILFIICMIFDVLASHA